MSLTNPPENFSKLPFEMDLDGTFVFVKQWLQSVEYGIPYDHDGSNHKGWHLYSPEFSLVDSSYIVACVIKPEWMIYSK